MATETTESGFTNDWQGERTLAECNLYMLKTEDTCDVSFRVGQKEEIVRAHSYILISRSCVFYSMLCGHWTKEDAIKIPDVSKEFFKEFMTFLYTDECFLTADNVTGLLYLSKKYAVHRLHRLCLSFLQTNLAPENACVVLEQAHYFDEKNLFQDALKVIDRNVEESLMSPDFDKLSLSCLCKILVLNNLDVHVKPEVVFDRVLSWASAECSRQGKEITPRNQREVLGGTVYLIGFTGFDVPSFVKKVVPSKLLDDSECLKIITHITCPDADIEPFRKHAKDRTERKALHKATDQSSERTTLLEVKLYDKSMEPSTEDHSLFINKFVSDVLDISCDQETLIHSITVPPSQAEYRVTVKQANNTIVTGKYVTTLNSAKIDLPSSVKMMPGLSYCVHVKHLSGKCPVMLMKGVKKYVCIGDKTLKVSQNLSVSNNIRGLIKKLTVS